ncbi:hypothetical protein INR49_004052 [Caranx melampygus]|nr:hypothetical protein INR49_004052 [Caranx melampygus]
MGEGEWQRSPVHTMAVVCGAGQRKEGGWDKGSEGWRCGVAATEEREKIDGWTCQDEELRFQRATDLGLDQLWLAAGRSHTSPPLRDRRPGWASGPVAWLVRWAARTEGPSEGARGDGGREGVVGPKWVAGGGKVKVKKAAATPLPTPPPTSTITTTTTTTTATATMFLWSMSFFTIDSSLNNHYSQLDMKWVDPAAPLIARSIASSSPETVDGEETSLRASFLAVVRQLLECKGEGAVTVNVGKKKREEIRRRKKGGENRGQAGNGLDKTKKAEGGDEVQVRLQEGEGDSPVAVAEAPAPVLSVQPLNTSALLQTASPRSSIITDRQAPHFTTQPVTSSQQHMVSPEPLGHLCALQSPPPAEPHRRYTSYFANRFEFLLLDFIVCGVPGANTYYQR